MTHGYEYIYEMFDLDDYYTDFDDFMDWDEGIHEDWKEIENVYEEFEDMSGGWDTEGWDTEGW